MKRTIWLVLLFILLLCINPASARTKHITLLTIGEVGDDTVGGTADAFLEIKHGTGRIFLDSFPLTKIDTQISTRYANEIACDYLDRECSRYDFFYTIRAGSTIVGGPSASAPLTVLTIAALNNLELRNDTVMTGTINSGGSIGPVGGIVKKAIAAEKSGFKRVLIPMFSINLEEILNTTTNTSEQNISNINISELSVEKANLSIEIRKVSNVEEALGYFTDTPVKQIDREIRVPEEYTSTMLEVANNLCDRSLELYKRVKLVDEDEINKSEEYINNINTGFESQDYYSAASYCFTMGVMLRRANLKKIEEKHPERIEQIYRLTKKAVKQFNQNLEDMNLTTLSELETYIIVKERLLEAEEGLTEIANNITADELAYALERYYSAVYWSNFFSLKGQKVNLDQEYLKDACYKKLSEAEERINYASLYVPLILQNSRNTIKHAHAFALKENYKMCLFKASFAKAESNLLLSGISIGTEQLEELAQEKLKAAKKVIAKEQSRDIFPIMGYSYYQYAGSLIENGDSLSSLIFSEYALELSNIEIYFPKKEYKIPIPSIDYPQNIDYSIVIFFASAFVLGLTIGILVTSRIMHKRKRKR